MSIFTKLILTSCFLCILSIVESKTLRNKTQLQVDQKTKDALTDLYQQKISGFKIQPASKDGIELLETYSAEEDIYEAFLNQDQDKSSIYVFYVSYEADEDYSQDLIVRRLLLCYIPSTDKVGQRMKYNKACSDFQVQFSFQFRLNLDEFSQLNQHDILNQVKDMKKYQ